MEKETICPEKILDVYVVWQNTDLTEGRGKQRNIATCLLKTTAERLGKGRGVQGCNCMVTRERAYVIDGRTYCIGNLEHPSDSDHEKEKKEKIKNAVLEKAKAVLTDEEIEILKEMNNG